MIHMVFRKYHRKFYKMNGEFETQIYKWIPEFLSITKNSQNGQMK